MKRHDLPALNIPQYMEHNVCYFTDSSSLSSVYSQLDTSVDEREINRSAFVWNGNIKFPGYSPIPIDMEEEEEEENYRDSGIFLDEDISEPQQELEYTPITGKTPRTALTFAAIWDPDRGISTFRGARLFDSRVIQDDTRVSLIESLDDQSFFDRFSEYGFHPDCEPHLASRFSISTTSTSGYIEIDSVQTPAALRTPQEYIWEPPPSQRPEISEPMALMPIRTLRNGSKTSFLTVSSVKGESPLQLQYTYTHMPVPRMGNVMGRNKLRKAASDAGWVHVEVSPGVDRVVIEDD